MNTKKLETSKTASVQLAQAVLKLNRQVFDNQCQSSTNSTVTGIAQVSCVFLGPLSPERAHSKINLTNTIMHSVSPVVKGQIESAKGDVWANVDEVVLGNVSNTTNRTLALASTSETFSNSMSVQMGGHKGIQPNTAQVMSLIPAIGHTVLNSPIQNSRSIDESITNLLTNYRGLDLVATKANMTWRTRTGAIVPESVVMRNKESIMRGDCEDELSTDGYPHVVEYTTLLMNPEKGEYDPLLAVVENNREASEAQGDDFASISIRQVGDAYIVEMAPSLMLKNLAVAERKLDAARKGCYVQLPSKSEKAGHKCADICITSAVADMKMPENLEGNVTTQLALHYTIFIPN